MSRLGAADMGIATFTDMLTNASMLASLSPSTPLIADADTGYGGPVMVGRTVTSYIRAGVAGLHLEDGVLARVSVRNISPGGVRITGPVIPEVGTHLMVELPNVGLVPGTVAWRSPHKQAFGVAFALEVEPEAVRQKVTGSYTMAPPPPPPLLRRVRIVFPTVPAL